MLSAKFELPSLSTKSKKQGGRNWQEGVAIKIPGNDPAIHIPHEVVGVMVVVVLAVMLVIKAQ